MSETEYWVGTARVVAAQNGEQLEQVCERICREAGEEKSKYHSSWEECLADNLYKKYVVASGAIYDVSDKKEIEGDDICMASRNPDGSIGFHLMFYNGGTCFSEMFEKAINSLTKE